MSVLSLIPEDKKKDSRKESIESVYSSSSRLNLLNKRKRVNPLADMSASKGDRFVAQRVLSAKAHRVKQLQNQLADAHFHLQELSNENRVLRALQKKQEIALQRYENSNAELPTVLHSHNEEIRVQQTKFKQLKQQFKEVTQKLKDRDMQYLQLKDEHTHLVELSQNRNLQEREKLQNQVTELTAKVQQQNDMISMLQRRIALEAKNYRHQLQNEINKHKDTRHDLDLAISNADKLSTIIEMKEKLISNAATRSVKSPVKAMSNTNMPRPTSRTKPADTTRNYNADKGNEDRSDSRSGTELSKLCESSRNIACVLSRDEEIAAAAEPRSRYVRSRASSNTRSTPSTRKNSKEPDELMELAKTVQDGMADLSIFEEMERNISPDDMQKKIEIMKQDLMNKITADKADAPKKSNLTRRQSTDESIEEDIHEEDIPPERPKSRGRRGSSVSFYDKTTIEETTTTVCINDFRGDEIEKYKPKREGSGTERKLSGKPLDKYCKDIIHDIEKSSKVIDRHMKQFNHSKFESDKLVEQLQAVDKINEFVNCNGEIPEETLQELNNNFKMLTDPTVYADAPPVRKRSISGRRNSRAIEPKSPLDDAAMSNKDMLDDLLGRK